MKSLFLLSRTTFVNEKTDPVGCIIDNVLQMFITVCCSMYFSFEYMNSKKKIYINGQLFLL